MSENEMSEFGQGYAYCLGLFLAHAERDLTNIEEDMQAAIWFNGAVDHLRELEIPQLLPAEKRQIVFEFKTKCFALSDPLRKPGILNDVLEAIATAKQLLLEWDMFNNIPTKKGHWE